MYSDNRWNEVTAGRVYPKVKTDADGTLVLVNPAEPFASPLRLEGFRAVRVSNPKAAHKPGDSPLRKPESYKNINSSNGSGPSAK